MILRFKSHLGPTVEHRVKPVGWVNGLYISDSPARLRFQVNNLNVTLIGGGSGQDFHTYAEPKRMGLRYF